MSKIPLPRAIEAQHHADPEVLSKRVETLERLMRTLLKRLFYGEPVVRDRADFTRPEWERTATELCDRLDAVDALRKGETP